MHRARASRWPPALLHPSTAICAFAASALLATLTRIGCWGVRRCSVPATAARDSGGLIGSLSAARCSPKSPFPTVASSIQEQSPAERPCRSAPHPCLRPKACQDFLLKLSAAWQCQRRASAIRHVCRTISPAAAFLLPALPGPGSWPWPDLWCRAKTASVSEPIARFAPPGRASRAAPSSDTRGMGTAERMLPDVLRLCGLR